jgi:4-amino-4-deoxy-L-arabinose transferase-like glycosyltransferase
VTRARGPVTHARSSPGRAVATAERALSRLDYSVVAVGGVVFAVLMALSGRYGFHRDELYFLDAARHLQGGYVDQPLLAPLLARVSLDFFGVSLAGLRLWPALAAWATIVVGASITRELGGGRRAQLLAAVGVATMPVLLAVDHLEGPTAFDLLAWSALSLVVVRIGRTGRLGLWLVAGAILGLGLTNKHSVAFFAIAFSIGVVLSGGGRAIASRWFVAGALVAAVFALPDVIWQARHGWATIAMTRSLHAENGGLGNVATWVGGQLVMTTIPFLPVWIAGLGYLWRSGRPLWRSLVWAYGLLFVFFAATTGKQIYYLAGAYVYLVAAGAIPTERWLSRSRRHPAVALGCVVAATAAAVPLVLPVLPAGDVGWTYAINQAQGESIGWPDFVGQVRAAWQAIPVARRRRAVIYTADYGEAGAINELGRASGLPTAVSGHNNEWWWGPGGATATTVLAVAPGTVSGYRAYLSTLFRRVRVVGTLRNAAGIHNQEWGGHLYLCTRPIRTWAQLWPELRHYD